MRKNAAAIGKSERASKAAERPRLVAKADPYFANLIGKAFRAIELIRQSHSPLTLTEVNRRMGGAKSSVFRILHTLESMGYLRRDPLGRYETVPEVRARDRAPYLHRFLHAAEPRLKRLNRDLQETVSLAALFQNHVEVVAVLDSPHIIRMGNSVGRILPPHASSLGKSIAAFQPEERQERLLRSYGIYRYTANTIVDENELKREFARIRKQGYAVDGEENVAGGFCFGAPIFAGAADAIGAVSVSAPAMRVSESIQKTLIAEVCRTASEISADLAP